MELYIDREELTAGLNHVQGILERRSTNRILSNVLLEANGDTLRVTATNTEVTYVGELAANVVVPGQITVDGSRLYQIGKSLPDTTVQMKLGAQDRLEIFSGAAWFKVVGLPAEDYPPVPNFEQTATLTLQAADLRWLIERTSFAISGEDNRYGINGAHLENMPGGDTPMLRMVATDGHRLSYAEIPYEGDFGMADRMLLPRKALAELRKICEGVEGELTLSFGENGALVELPGTRFFFRLIDGEFPDYRQVVPSGFQRRVMLSKPALSDALKRVGLLASDKTRPVRFEFTEDTLILTTQNLDIGESREEVQMELEGKALELGFNHRYFQDVLSVVKDDKVVLELGDALSPALIRSPDEEKGLFVVMPMRLD